MKAKKVFSSNHRLVLLLLFTLVFNNVEAQNCAALSGIINTYAPVTSISGNLVTRGTTSGAVAPFAVGDFVVLIQMTGPPPVQVGSNMGKYELRKVTSISGNDITLDGIVNTYTTTEKVQIVRAPYCPTGTISAIVTAKGWDGSTGGIIALKGSSLTLNADIDASGSGFSQINSPWTVASTSLSSGLGSTDGRGFSGDGGAGGAGKGGGGIGGGGGAFGINSQGVRGGNGGDTGNGGAAGLAGPVASGLNGGDGTAYSSGGGGSGGGGGVIGGGGGGGGCGGTNIFPSGLDLTGYSGGGGGVGGGGGGGGGKDGGGGGGGGGGVKGIGNGANALANDSGGGGGGGGYGGGGGSASAWSGGDDSQGGGGGGAWTGGGIGGKRGASFYHDGGAGNLPVSVVIENGNHYLNTIQPRLMMGGAGGNSACQSGGLGGGIVIINFNEVVGSNFGIKSNGENMALTPNCPQATGGSGLGGAGGAGGGGGGQLLLNVNSFASNTVIEAKGGKGGDGNNSATYHGGTGGAGGGGGGVWVYGPTTSSNTGGETITLSNTNLLGIGSTAAGVAGGTAGADTTNPKNALRTGTGGAGGNGLIIQSPSIPVWLASCSVTLTAIPGSCTPATNQYSVTGSLTFTDAPASGTLTVSEGAITQVFTAPFTSPQAFTLSGLTADGVSHTVTAVFSDDVACTSTANYTAPATCGISCVATQTHTTPVCNSNGTAGNAADDYFSFSVTGTLTDGSGNYIIKIGAFTSAAVTSGNAVTITGNGLAGNPTLSANGAATYTVRVEDSTNSACFTEFMVGPVAACSNCPMPNCGTVTVQKD